MREKRIKQLNIEISEELHAEIKGRAGYRNAKVKDYVMEAIMDRILKEREYETNNK